MYTKLFYYDEMKKNVIFENFPSKYLERIVICCTFALASLLKMVSRQT